MMPTFSAHGNRSTQPRKQRKFLYNAPLHVRQRWMRAPLAEALRKKYGRKTAQVRKGDIVTVLRGQFRGKRGKVEKISLNKARIYVENVQMVKRDGSKAYYPVHASKVRIEEVVLDDKRRRMLFEAKEK